MTIAAKEKSNPELWWILEAIEKEYLATPKEGLVEFWIKNDDATAPPDRQKKLLQKLEKDYGVIKIREPFSRKLFPNTRPVLFGIEESKGFFLEILPKFDKFYEECKQKQKDESTPQGEVKFDDDKAVLKLGERECPLPPYKNEHFLCRAMFKFPIKELVDWSLIYKEITGEELQNAPKNKRMVYDATEAVNTRVKEIFGIDKLFIWASKTIKRVY